MTGTNGFKYAAPSDKEIDKAFATVLRVHPYRQDLITARRILKKRRGWYSHLASLDDDSHVMLAVFVAIQAAGIVDHVLTGSDVNEAALSEEDVHLIANSAVIAAVPEGASERVMRIAVVAAFLFDPGNIANTAIMSMVEGGQA